VCCELGFALELSQEKTIYMLAPAD